MNETYIVLSPMACYTEKTVLGEHHEKNRMFEIRI